MCVLRAVAFRAGMHAVRGGPGRLRQGNRFTQFAQENIRGLGTSAVSMRVAD